MIYVDIPKFTLNLQALKLSNIMPEDAIDLLKEQNRFLFEETPEEKILNDKLKNFNYVEGGDLKDESNEEANANLHSQQVLKTNGNFTLKIN